MARHLRTESGSLPRRVDSLIAHKAPVFTEIEDELRDIKRVHSQGQEEDLRMALSRMITRVEDLVCLLVMLRYHWLRLHTLLNASCILSD